MDQYEKMEHRFIDCYRKYRNHSVMVLLGFYKGQYHKFLLSTFFFVIKHAPSLFAALLTANVINGAIAGGEEGKNQISLDRAFSGASSCKLASQQVQKSGYTKNGGRFKRRSGPETSGIVHSVPYADTIRQASVQDHT